MSAIDLICLLAGVLVGALLSLGFLRTKYRGVNAQLTQNLEAAESDLNAERERRAILEGENRRIPGLETEIDLGRDKIISLQEDLNIKIAERASAKTVADEVPTLKRILDSADQKIRTLGEENVELRTAMKAQQENAARELAMLDEAKEKMTDAFGALSRKTLQENNQSFIALAEQTFSKLQQGAQGDLEKRQQAISEIVKPVGDTLQKFGERVRELELQRQHAYSTLSEQVKQLADGQTQLRSETTNLVRALRAPSTRGRWGEIQLRRVVEMAGMVQHCDIFEQVTETTDEVRQRPDMIVKLPGNKNVIVDAKVPLAAYLEALEATDENIRRDKMRDHARQVRDHIQKLSKKSYWEQFQPTPEFVILFLSGEAFLYAALEQDPSLIEDGITDRVILATPTTLIAMLKAIAYGWRQENIEANAREISELGTELYKRLATVGEHFGKLGGNLEKAVKSYNDSVGSLERNVLTTARKLKEHGISTGDKELEELNPIDLTTRSIERTELRAPEPIAVGPGGTLFG